MTRRRRPRIPSALRPWVERTAPTLTAEDWPEIERFVADYPGGTTTGLQLSIGRVTYRQARALLAYRDEVARGLSDTQGHVWPMDTAAPEGVKATEPTCALCGHDGPSEGVGGVCPKQDSDWGRVIAERARELEKSGAA